MRKITELIIHCSATRPDWMEGAPITAKVAEMRKWHVQGRGWNDIGYHFLIDRPGDVAEGRPVAQTGAHVMGHNTGTIGICLIGGHGSAETDRFHQHFTEAQNEALQLLLVKLQGRFGPGLKVSGHNEYAAKACPGFNVATWLKTNGDTTAPAIPPDHATEAARYRWRLAEIRDTAANALIGD